MPSLTRPKALLLIGFWLALLPAAMLATSAGAIQAPNIEVTPASLSQALCSDQTATQPITICNTGDAPLIWRVTEDRLGTRRAALAARSSIPAGDSAPARGRAPAGRTASLGPAPRTGSAAAGQDAGRMPELPGMPAYAVDIYPDENLVMFDPATPGAWTIIGSVAGSLYVGGDFLNADPSVMYVLDYYTNNLYWLDTTTAAAAPIGPAIPVEGEWWTGMTSAADGTLYASSSSTVSSTLYTIDPDSGAATPIGPIDSPCIIAIAINYNGDMYGLDICTDELVKIDPDTGQITPIGPIGFNASYAQGMDFDEDTGILYLTAFNGNTYQGELRIADLHTGNTTLVGVFPGGAQVDSPAFVICCPGWWWLYEDPPGGTVEPGTCQRVDVNFMAPGFSPGDYPVGLRVRSNDPDEPTVIMPVTMTVLPPADISSVTYTAAGLHVAFDATAAGGPALTFAWDFGDGGTSNVEDPVHTYALGGCYTVTLDVSNGCGEDGWAGRVCVCEPAGGAGFRWSPPEPLVEQTVAFSATVEAGTPPFTFTWGWGDGTEPGSGQYTSHAYEATGTYSVTLTVDGACGQATAQAAVSVVARRFSVYLPLCVRRGGRGF